MVCFSVREQKKVETKVTRLQASLGGEQRLRADLAEAADKHTRLQNEANAKVDQLNRSLKQVEEVGRQYVASDSEQAKFRAVESETNPLNTQIAGATAETGRLTASSSMGLESTMRSEISVLQKSSSRVRAWLAPLRTSSNLTS